MSKLVRIHFYFGPICKSEIIDYSKSFSDNKLEVFNQFGISKENSENYVLKLMNGGVVERNEVLFHDDRVMILLKEDFIKSRFKNEDTPD